MTEELLNEELETVTSGYANVEDVATFGTIQEITEETEEEKPLTLETMLTDEEREAIKYLNVDKTLRSLKQRMAEINDSTNGIIKNPGDADMLDAAIANFTLEQIKAMDAASLQRIYTVEETDQPMEFDISVDDADYVEFMRDYLVLRKETLEANVKFDAEISKLEAEIAEHQEEFEKALNDFTNISNTVISRMKTLAEESEDEKTREMASNILKAIDDALHLDTVKAFVKNYKYGTETLRLYRDHADSMSTYNKYLEVSKKLDCDKDLIVFSGLENNYLPTEYHKRPNMFVFTVMHMVASWRHKCDNDPYYGLFLTQLYVNLKNLYTDRFDTEEDRVTFINAIKEVLDVHL